MKLYQLAFSPACQKVVAVAHEVGVPLELLPVELFKGGAKTPAMLAKNPNGKVPILEDGDFVLWESTAMMAYIAATAGRSDLAPTTPRERAVLLLRDVVGLSAAETAEVLACSVSSANSTLHRARVALEERVGPRADWAPESDAVDRALLERYLRAWDHGDLDAIIALLHDDVTLSMPPSPTWVAGRADVARFFRVRAIPPVRSILVEANGRPAAGFYRLVEGASPFLALQLVEIRDGRIRVIDHFMAARGHAAFFASGVPRTLG